MKYCILYNFTNDSLDVSQLITRRLTKLYSSSLFIEIPNVSSYSIHALSYKVNSADEAIFVVSVVDTILPYSFLKMMHETKYAFKKDLNATFILYTVFDEIELLSQAKDTIELWCKKAQIKIRKIILIPKSQLVKTYEDKLLNRTWEKKLEKAMTSNNPIETISLPSIAYNYHINSIYKSLAKSNNISTADFKGESKYSQYIRRQS